MNSNKQYDPKILRKLQLSELSVFKDFIKICEENSIFYNIYTEKEIISKTLNYNVLYYYKENLLIVIDNISKAPFEFAEWL